MEKTKKIIILICYYGEFPWYFSYFLHSCSYNPTVDFVIFTETDTELRLPPNVSIKKIPFEEVKIMAEEKLGFKVNITNVYKLCDFKPAFGLIFSEYTKGYDFWGQGDIDVIYGDIRGFIKNELLKEYDILTVRHDFLVGYFTLFKNCDSINQIFKYSKDYKKVFSSSEHFCFDECNFAFWQMDDKVGFEDVKCEIESMTHVVKKLQKRKQIKVLFELFAFEGLAGKLSWNRGKLVYKRRHEIMLYHLIKLKKIYQPREVKSKIPDFFRISPTRIYFD